ncbi:MAG: hypothetical protein ACJ780_15745 [Solirubrobacteraceae bacterium]
MRYSTPLILQVQLGDEIWQQSLRDAIGIEAEIVADHAGPDLLPMPNPGARVAMRDPIAADMTASADRRYPHRGSTALTELRAP